MILPEEISKFFEKQAIAVASTINSQGKIHCAIKEVLGVDPQGNLLLIDLFCNRTYKNLKSDSRISVTVVSEKEFKGFTVQGKAKVIPRSEINSEHLIERENKIIQRISKRLINSLQTDSRSKGHFEAELPPKPRYLIQVSIDEVIDLSPPKIKNDSL